MLIQHRGIFLFTLIMMSATGLFATDIYLPALPQMTQYFNCTQTDIQFSFTIFLLGLAGCQLIYGVLSDHFGKKRILLFALVLFVIASVLCAFAVSLNQFIFFRLLQAIGGGAGSVICRAIVRGSYAKTESVKVFSIIFSVIGLAPAVAPLIGGYLTHFFDWRSSFYFMAFFGCMNILLVFAFLNIPIQQEAPSKTFTKSILYTSWIQHFEVLKNIKFLGYVLILCASFSVFRCYTIESPFVFDMQGYLVNEMSHFYIGLSLAYLIGNLMAKRLVNTKTVEQVIRLGFCFSLLGAISMVVFAHSFSDNPYAIIIPMSVITLGNGFLFPTGSAGAMASVPQASSGTASGLMGSLQFVIAALCVNWVGDICQGQAKIMSLYISSISFIGLCSFLFLLYRPKSQMSSL